jgi:hypothetical protein
MTSARKFAKHGPPSLLASVGRGRKGLQTDFWGRGSISPFGPVIPVACREFFQGIAFKDFSALAKLKGWSAQELAHEFPGIAASDGRFEGETSGTYFERVLHGDPSRHVVIPYRRVIEKYLREARLLIAAGLLRTCRCGCGSPVFSPHQKFAHDYDESARQRPQHSEARRTTSDDGEASTAANGDDQCASADSYAEHTGL